MDPYPHDREKRGFYSDCNESLTAQALCARLALGHTAADDPMIPLGAGLLKAKLPDPINIDFCYWYFGTLALREIGGQAWTLWEPALLRTVLSEQVQQGKPCELAGSWHPYRDPWGAEGGRVYATAIHAMLLEYPYRYPRLAPSKKN